MKSPLSYAVSSLDTDQDFDGLEVARVAMTTVAVHLPKAAD